MVNNKIRLTILFAVEDGEALYSQKTNQTTTTKRKPQDMNLIVAQIFSSLLQNLGLN